MAIAQGTRLALVLCGAGVLASSCSLFGVDDQTFSDDAALGSVRTVRLDDVTGDVTVRSGASPSIQRTVTYSEGYKPGRTYRMDGGTLVLGGCDEQPDCGVSYTVTVPSSVAVTGNSGSGRISVTGLSGVDVRAGSGDVRAEDISGPVSVDLNSGGVTLARVRGDVDVRSGSGSIDGTELAGGTVRAHGDSGSVRLGLTNPSTVEANTDSGDVELTVPAGPYRVNGGDDGDNGSRRIDVAQQAGAPRTLTVSSDSGEVSVHS